MGSPPSKISTTNICLRFIIFKIQCPCSLHISTNNSVLFISWSPHKTFRFHSWLVPFLSNIDISMYLEISSRYLSLIILVVKTFLWLPITTYSSFPWIWIIHLLISRKFDLNQQCKHWLFSRSYRELPHTKFNIMYIYSYLLILFWGGGGEKSIHVNKYIALIIEHTIKHIGFFVLVLYL